MKPYRAHPDWCMRHDCYHPTGGGAHHDQHRRGLLHRHGDCTVGAHDDDGEDFSVRVSWEARHDKGLFSEAEDWTLDANLLVLDGDSGKFVRVHLGSTDLRLIADYLVSEADQIDDWRQAEIARRAEEGAGE